MTPSFPTRRSSDLTYDAVGNRLTETDGTGVTTAYSYDEENRLLAMGAVAFAYDDAGNQVARTEGGVTQGYGYDARGFMTQATTAGTGTTTYTYEAQRERGDSTGVLGTTGITVEPYI